jgi:hypothetical protein
MERSYLRLPSPLWLEGRLAVLLYRPTRLSVTLEGIGGLDLSFQLDRRISELFMTMWAQNMGINVHHGVGIGFEVAKEDGFLTSTNKYAEGSFKAPRVVLKDSSGAIGTHVGARLVCDATGFSRGLTSKFGNREICRVELRRVLGLLQRERYRQC